MTPKTLPEEAYLQALQQAQLLIDAGHAPDWTERGPSDPLRLMLRRVLDGSNETTPHRRFKAAMSRVDCAGYPAVIQQHSPERDDESGLIVSCLTVDLSADALKPIAARIQQRQLIAELDEESVWIEQLQLWARPIVQQVVPIEGACEIPLGDLRPPLEKGAAWAHEGGCFVVTERGIREARSTAADQDPALWVAQRVLAFWIAALAVASERRKFERTQVLWATGLASLEHEGDFLRARMGREVFEWLCAVRKTATDRLDNDLRENFSVHAGIAALKMTTDVRAKLRLARVPDLPAAAVAQCLEDDASFVLVVVATCPAYGQGVKMHLEASCGDHGRTRWREEIEARLRKMGLAKDLVPTERRGLVVIERRESDSHEQHVIAARWLDDLSCFLAGFSTRRYQIEEIGRVEFLATKVALFLSQSVAIELRRYFSTV